MGFRLVNRDAIELYNAFSRGSSLQLEFSGSSLLRTQDPKASLLQPAKSGGWRCLPGGMGMGDISLPLFEISWARGVMNRKVVHGVRPFGFGNSIETVAAPEAVEVLKSQPPRRQGLDAVSASQCCRIWAALP